MRVLIVGGTGMLGHKLLQKWKDKFELAATIRHPHAQSPLGKLGLMIPIYDNVVAERIHSIEEVLDDFGPQTVVNCIGIVKQIEEAYDPITSIQLNALFPHMLARACVARGARLIHISTDCVFSGKQGPYKETDMPDAEDLYGRTKLVGEAVSDGVCTLRTSIIGHELSRGTGLLEWFLKQTGPAINGYRKALFSGFPTTEMADILRMIISDHPDLSGLWHVSSEPIDKFDLLTLVRDVYKKHIQIDEYTEFKCDRRLDSSCFRERTGFSPKSWPEMIDAMHVLPSV